jgi:hypothetical protein
MSPGQVLYQSYSYYWREKNLHSNQENSFQQGISSYLFKGTLKKGLLKINKKMYENGPEMSELKNPPSAIL